MTYRFLFFSVLVFFTLSAGLPEAVSSEDKAARQETAATMAEVVVTASRDRENVQRVPANVSVITARDIEQSGATTLVEILDKFESIHFRDYSGNSPQSLIDMRGFGGDNPFGKTLIMLDGRRLNRPDMASINWLQIPLSQIDRVEVVRGAGSVLYGDAAIGGVINVITKKGRGKPQANVSVVAGSYGLNEERAGVSGSADRWSYALNGNNRFDFGYRERSKSSSQGGSVDFGYDASELFRISFGANLNQNAYLFPGALTRQQMVQDRQQFQPGHNNDDGMDRDTNVNVRMESILGAFGRFDLKLMYGDRTIRANMDSWFVWTDSRMKTYTLNPQYILDRDILGHANKLTAGVDYYNEPYQKDFFTRRDGFTKSSWADLKRDSLGYYIRDEFSLLPVILLSAGYRTEKTSIGGTNTDAVTPANSFTDQDKTYDAEAYELGLTWLVGKKSKIFSKYGTVYRIPFMDEIMSFNGGGGGFLRSLEKEKGSSMEAGTQFYPLEQLKLGLTVFRIDMEDEIQYVGTYPTGYNQNTGKTRHDGAEFSFSYQWDKWARFYGNATYHVATFENGLYNKKEMPLVPNRMANLGVEIHLPWNLMLRPEMRHVGNAFLSGDNANTGEKLEAHTLFDLYLFYRPTLGKTRVTAFAGVNNLTNVEYSAVGFDGRPWGANTYYPMPGVTFKGGISLAF